MSTLREAPIAEFVTHLRDRFGLSTLVETGTFEGDSTLWAAERFANVITIDIRDDDRATAHLRCRDHQNIDFLLGDTREWLPDVVASLDVPALFWLDAHAAPGLFGDKNDWPVLDELEAIFTSPYRNFILIDDAHCFLSQTPYPECPTYKDVTTLAEKGGYACRLKYGVIVLVPPDTVDELDEGAWI